VLDLVEEVRRGGEARVLKQGDQDLALLTPIVSREARTPRRQPSSDHGDAILNIIGIGASSEPTDVANHEKQYLAEAAMPSQR
jgi:hypothetical protein